MGNKDIKLDTKSITGNCDCNSGTDVDHQEKSCNNCAETKRSKDISLSDTSILKNFMTFKQFINSNRYKTKNKII